jgi:acyl-CoA synthetase (AMP-forming)/AMP-acid ligase II
MTLGDPIPVLEDRLDEIGPNLAALPRWGAERFGAAPALEVENDANFTYRELAEHVAGIADALADIGVNPGDRIGVALDNRAMFPLLVLGAAHHGAGVLPLNPRFSDDELRAIFDVVAPTHLVALPDFLEHHRDVIADRRMRLAGVDGEHDSAASPFGPTVGDWRALGHDNYAGEIAWFGLTSGSTGLPKVVAKTQQRWLLAGQAMRAILALGPEDRMLNSQPFYYGDPLLVLMGCLHAGATAILLRRFRSGTFMSEVAQRRATKFMTIGSMPAMLLASPPSEADRSHEAVAAWSIALPRDRHAELETRFGIPWLEIYGSSEAVAVLAETLGDSHVPGEGWLGRVCPYQQVRLVDDKGTQIEGDGVGMLDVRGPLVAQEYWGGPPETQEVFLEGGWYRTGDVMERRGSRHRFVRREKDIVRRAGENVSAQEVEQALRRHHAVTDAAVIPRPDPLRGEEVWAVLQLRNGLPDHPVSAAEDVLRFAAGALARHKVPRFVSFVREFPRTPSERVAKRKLPELLGEPAVDTGERHRPGAVGRE